MATIINNPEPREESDAGAGWAVAVVILLAVIGVGAYLWFQHRSTAAVPSGTNTSNTINVTIPSTSGTTSSGSSF